MKTITTTRTLDATKYLPCESCVNNFNCKRYMLACEFIHNKLFFAADLICTLECAEELCISKQIECVRKGYSQTTRRARQAFRLFLPTINNALNAFYKYEYEEASDYTKQTLISVLANTLEDWNSLTYFDFMFNQNIKNKRDILQKEFEYEITKSEKQKLAEQNTSENERR